MPKTIPFIHTTKGEIAKEIFHGDITGIDFAIPQGIATLLMDLGLDYSMYVMSYKGEERFGRLVHLGESFFYMHNLDANLDGFYTERDHGLPSDVEITLEDSGINTMYWALHLESGVYRPINIAQRWCEEQVVELKHVGG